MSKQGEINYLQNLIPAGIIHACNKPFSDKNCGILLAEIGSIISLIPTSTNKILDIGCGTGWTSVFLAKTKYEVVGMDISPEMIRYANIKKDSENLKNLKFLVQDYENSTFNSDFDCVIFHDSLHHADDIGKALTMAFNALKKGGVMIISEPGKGHNKTKTSINAMEKYDVNEKDIVPKDIKKLCKKIGFNEIKIYPKTNILYSLLFSNIKDLDIKNIYKKIFKFNIIKYIASFYLIAFYKNKEGIIVITK